MLITLDRMAKRYHQLPSYLVDNATTFDLKVLDIGMRYERVEQQKANGTYKKPVPKLSKEQMMKMIKQANAHVNSESN